MRSAGMVGLPVERRNRAARSWRRMSMRRLTAAVVAMVAAASFVLAGAVPAFACSCGTDVTVGDAVGPHTAVAFVGTAISVTEVGYPEELPIEQQEQGIQGPEWAPLRWTFEVETVLVGDVPQTVDVGSGYGGGDCGVDFADVGRIGVVASNDDLGLATSICGGVWDADELIAAYGPGTDPGNVAVSTVGGSADSGALPWIWVGLAAVVILAGLALTVSRLRRAP